MREKPKGTHLGPTERVMSIEAYATLLPIDTILKRLSMMPISFLKKAA